MIVNSEPILSDSLGVKSQDFRGQIFDGDPGEDEEPSVIGYEMQVFLFGRFVPSDEGVAGFDGPGGRSPA